MMVYIKTQAVPSKTACFRHQPRKCIYLKELLQEGSDSCQQLVSCIDILTGSGPAKLKMAYLWFTPALTQGKRLLHWRAALKIEFHERS